jgi:two-component system cell cycle sensor histidine kinase/response regulator CckA
MISQNPTHEKLEQRIEELEKEAGKLRKTEEELGKYRFMVESAHDAIFFKDLKSRYIIANDKTLEVFGMSREDVIGKNDYELMFDQKEAGKNISNDRMVFESGKPAEVSKCMTGADGREKWFQTIKVPQFDDEGRVTGLVGIARDITYRKQSEEALRASESKFRSLFDLSPQAIALTEMEKGRLIDVNDKFCELTKYAKEEVIGLTTTEAGFYSEESRTRFITKLKKSGEVNGLEMDFKGKEDSVINTTMFSRIVRIIDEAFILTIFIDITDQIKLERQLRQAQKMEALGTLAGGIAHDFNNLLMGIQGRTSLMLMDTGASHAYLENLRGIEDYVKSASDLTRQLLGFARGGKYEIKPTDLNALIINENIMFGRTRKEINIREKFEQNLWMVKVDQRQIEQVLLNVYVNASQAMPAGGDLYVQTENVIIDEDYIKPYQTEPGKYVKISIKDTGVGMDEATQQRIFDPFFTTKEMGRGTGLGLASVYGIIKNHNGFINVYSAKGKGTTFNIYLPAFEKKALKAGERGEKLLRGTETLLLVDDEDMIIDVCCKVVTKLGYNVLTVKSGKEAIEIYKENRDRIHMVILDMIMPTMSGAETYDKLKEINPDVKVLLSSGYNINGQVAEILDRGCNGFIQKPFNMADLSKKIREILDKD